MKNGYKTNHNWIKNKNKKIFTYKIIKSNKTNKIIKSNKNKITSINVRLLQFMMMMI